MAHVERIALNGAAFSSGRGATVVYGSYRTIHSNTIGPDTTDRVYLWGTNRGLESAHISLLDGAFGGYYTPIPPGQGLIKLLDGRLLLLGELLQATLIESDQGINISVFGYADRYFT